jgi:hypothetical protein
MRLIQEDVVAAGYTMQRFNLPVPPPPQQGQGGAEAYIPTASPEHLQQKYDEFVSNLNADQKAVFDTLKAAIQSPPDAGSKAFFLNSPGGCGKTFLLNLLLLHCQVFGIAFKAVATSGLAALLLILGRTAHSTCGIPIPIDSMSCSYLGKESQQARELKQAKVIVWAESLMSHRHNIECVDRLLRDLTGSDVPFGGKVVVFGGDFRQILPVVRHGREGSIVGASLTKSPLWIQGHIKVLNLTTNMRIEKVLRTQGPAEALRLKLFSDRLLSIGDGLNGTDVECDPVWKLEKDTVPHLIEAIYGNLTDVAVSSNQEILLRRCILAPRNKDADVINDHRMNIFQVKEGSSPNQRV